MIWLLAGLVLVYGLVVFRGAPYVNSHSSVVSKGFELAGLKEGQTLVDLGSGSGNILLAAAKRGVKSYGLELNPLLVFYSRFKLRGQPDATVEWGDFWLKKLPECDVVYVFITANFAEKMTKHIQSNISNKTKVLSYSYELPGMKLLKKDSGYYLYEAVPVANKGRTP